MYDVYSAKQHTVLCRSDEIPPTVENKQHIRYLSIVLKKNKAADRELHPCIY